MYLFLTRWLCTNRMFASCESTWTNVGYLRRRILMHVRDGLARRLGDRGLNRSQAVPASLETGVLQLQDARARCGRVQSQKQAGVGVDDITGGVYGRKFGRRLSDRRSDRKR